MFYFYYDEVMIEVTLVVKEMLVLLVALKHVLYYLIAYQQ
jgi:hypothetical protein